MRRANPFHRAAGFALSLIVAAALAVATAGASSQTVSRLYAQIGPGRALTLKNALGQAVFQIHRGTYTWVIRDRSKICHFALRGPNVDKMITTDRFRGTKRYTLTLIKARYGYGCDRPGREAVLNVTK